MGLLTIIWDSVGSNAAEIIALCAFSITIYQAYLSRKHNSLSVRPHLSDFSHRNTKGKVGSLTFSVENNGVGPAIIGRFKWKRISDNNEFQDLEEIRQELYRVLNGNISNDHVTYLASGYALPANEKRNILSIQFPLEDDQSFDEIQKVLSDYELEIDYCCMYGKKYYLTTKDS